MVIGVAIDEHGIAAVRLHDDGSRSTLVLPVTGSLEADLDELLVRAAPHADPAVHSIAFDLSAVLRPAEAGPLTVIRIAPRAPLERGDEPRVGEASILHVRGGHTTLGEELAPFDAGGLRAAAVGIPAASRVVVTSAGALVNPDHELAAGEILLEHDGSLSVTFSHVFEANSFATRERTAVWNSALVPGADALTTALSLVAGRRFPDARLSVTRNDGGRVPLSRFPASPVHSAFSGAPTEFLGAAALQRMNDGDLVLATPGAVLLGSIGSGAPSVVPQFRLAGSRLATQAAHLVPASEILLGGRAAAPALFRAAGSPLPAWLDAPEQAETQLELRALGAACAPLSDWALGLVGAVNSVEMAHELQAAEARVRGRLVSSGALPSSVRILESRLVATTYEHARVVSVRVRGVAGEPVGDLLAREEIPCG